MIFVHSLSSSCVFGMAKLKFANNAIFYHPSNISAKSRSRLSLFTRICWLSSARYKLINLCGTSHTVGLRHCDLLPLCGFNWQKQFAGTILGRAKEPHTCVAATGMVEKKPSTWLVSIACHVLTLTRAHTMHFISWLVYIHARFYFSFHYIISTLNLGRWMNTQLIN